MVNPRNQDALVLMRKSGRIASYALKKTINAIRIGISANELDKIAGKEILRLGGDWSYKTVPKYKWATCININEGVVHGIPTGYRMQDGDLVSVDLAVIFKGWHTDCAWTVMVGQESRVKGHEKKERFLKVGEEALWNGIAKAVVGNTIGDIGAAIQGKVEGAGYHVVRSLIGHGVGEKLHEDPQIPGYGKAGTGLVLEEGMTLAIEVIYGEGTSDVILDKDGWTYKTADGSLGGLFEMTVVVGSPAGEAGKKKAEVLTDWRKV